MPGGGRAACPTSCRSRCRDAEMERTATGRRPEVSDSGSRWAQRRAPPGGPSELEMGHRTDLMRVGGLVEPGAKAHPPPPLPTIPPLPTCPWQTAAGHKCPSFKRCARWPICRYFDAASNSDAPLALDVAVRQAP